MIKDEGKLGRFIDKRGVAFISSMDEDGYPNTKAMLSPRKREGIKIFYFSTSTSSLHVQQYRKNPKAWFATKGLC